MDIDSENLEQIKVSQSDSDEIKIKKIYDSFIAKLNLIKNKQFVFLNNLFIAKQQADLKELRKKIQ